MKALDIALKDMLQSFRSASALVFMFGIPLGMTGLFYLMFGRIAGEGEFNLSPTTVAIANLDEGGPRIQSSTRALPDAEDATTMGELVVAVLTSDDMDDLLDVAIVDSAAAARASVDSRQAQVAIIIPPDFSRQFADLYGHAEIEMYQDPTLSLGPGIVQSILHQFMDGMSGVLIALHVGVDSIDSDDPSLPGVLVARYLDESLAEKEDLSEVLLDVRAPTGEDQTGSLLLRMITPIMGGIMVFYAFYTGASTAESILTEEEGHTLPRLFTTPTPQAVILGGKFLAVVLTVAAQMVVLILAARLIFSIPWGPPAAMALVVAGCVLLAASLGIFMNSMIKGTRQGGVIFGGVLTLTGMLGMIRVFAVNSPAAARLGDSVSLIVPQGWAVRAMLQAIAGAPLGEIAVTLLVMAGWSAALAGIGIWRFRGRYA
jgi:ABC-2 type transport system permease protein